MLWGADGRMLSSANNDTVAVTGDETLLVNVERRRDLLLTGGSS